MFNFVDIYAEQDTVHKKSLVINLNLIDKGVRKFYLLDHNTQEFKNFITSLEHFKITDYYGLTFVHFEKNEFPSKKNNEDIYQFIGRVLDYDCPGDNMTEETKSRSGVIFISYYLKIDNEVINFYAEAINQENQIYFNSKEEKFQSAFEENYKVIESIEYVSKRVRLR